MPSKTEISKLIIGNSSKKKLNNYDSQNNLRGKIKSRITSNDNFKINI